MRWRCCGCEVFVVEMAEEPAARLLPAQPLLYTEISNLIWIAHPYVRPEAYRMSEIKIQLPDGSVRSVPSGTTALDVAKSISPRLADAALVAHITPPGVTSPNNGGRLVDLTFPIEEDVKLRLLTEKDPEALEVFRHSSAHLMAAAVLELFPETKLGHGPATETGFFYDFLRGNAVHARGPGEDRAEDAGDRAAQRALRARVPGARRGAGSSSTPKATS